MIYGDKQFRKVITQTAATLAASPRATAADLADGEVQAFNVSGLGDAGAGERFKFFTNVAGVISSSDVIDPAKVLKSTTSAFSAKVNQVSTITIAGTVTAGDSWEATIRILDYGMTSAWDYTNIYAQYVAVTGNTVDDVAAGLAASFNQNIATHAGEIDIVASSSTADLILTGTATEYKEFQFDGRPLNFTSSVSNPVVIAEVLTTPAEVGVGEGTEMHSLEFFSKMVTGDPYAKSEISYNAPVLADSALTYDVIEISYYSERQSAPGDKQRKVITIPVLASLLAADVNGQLIDPLTVIGLGLSQV